jgi:HAD superfamily hydrolase (TIGR01549 family)
VSGIIRAVTFDLWDTIVHDNSDEPKRAARGLPPKPEARRLVLWEALNADRPTSLEEVTLAYDVGDAAFNKVWREHHITWTIEERLTVMLTGLGRSLAPEAMASVIDALGRMEVDIPPDLIPGMDDALAELASRYRLCIVSDAIVTPGSGLRELLEAYDVKRHFGGFAFSDEVGVAKPHRGAFDSAARQLGVEVTEMVHVGDRDHNDIKGPQALGMKAVLFTATRDADEATTTADAICRTPAELPAIIDGMRA